MRKFVEKALKDFGYDEHGILLYVEVQCEINNVKYNEKKCKELINSIKKGR